MSAGLLCLPQQASKLPCLLPPLSPPQALSPHRLLRISYQPKSLSVREVTGGFEGLSTDRSAPTHSEACRGRATGPWRGGSPFLFHPSPRSEEGISRRRLHPRHYGHPGRACVCVCVCGRCYYKGKPMCSTTRICPYICSSPQRTVCCLTVCVCVCG